MGKRMERKIVSFLICMLLIVSLTPIVESITKNTDTIYKTNIELGLNTFDSYAEKPIWNVGDKWNYRFSFNLYINNENGTVNIYLTILNIYLLIEEETEDAYNLSIDGDINGHFSFKSGITRIRGELKNTVMNGYFIVDKDFSIKNVSLYIDGTLKVSIVPVTIDIDLIISCNPPIKLIDFPLYVGKEWFTDSSICNISTLVSLPGLRNLPIPDIEEIPEQFIFSNESIINGSNFSCTDIENISVANMGKYEAYKIESVNKTNYFSPVLGNFIEIVSPPNDYTNVEFYLQSTNYTVPGAPNIPNEPEGINKGKPGTSFEYSTSTTDNENDDIYYLFDWDDGSNSGWLGPFPSGLTINASHIWLNRGSYSVRVKAKDTKDHESRWSEILYVNMPKVKQYNLLQSLFDFLYEHEHFPIIKKFLSNVSYLIEEFFL
jgi:hypothetical protein